MRNHLEPTPDFGLVLEMPAWQALADRLRMTGMRFLFQPQVRFEGQPSEQWTLFLCDPNGNPIEVKAFAHGDAVNAL